MYLEERLGFWAIVDPHYYDGPPHEAEMLTGPGWVSYLPEGVFCTKFRVAPPGIYGFMWISARLCDWLMLALFVRRRPVRFSYFFFPSYDRHYYYYLHVFPSSLSTISFVLSPGSRRRHPSPLPTTVHGLIFVFAGKVQHYGTRCSETLLTLLTLLTR